MRQLGLHHTAFVMFGLPVRILPHNLTCLCIHAFSHDTYAYTGPQTTFVESPCARPRGKDSSSDLNSDKWYLHACHACAHELA